MKGSSNVAVGGLDLGELGALASLLDGPQVHTGEPGMYDVNLIHEDENNARRDGNPGFSEDSIAELASTFRRREAEGKRGMKSPMSLRPHPDIPGHYVINHGHRRFRAAKVAGLTRVPAFEDPDFDDLDQLIENVQREDLTARELTDAIGRKLSQGMTQAQIAAELGKSKAWVSQHASMLDLPDPVAAAVASGHVTDVTLANELATAHREDPKAVEKLLQSPETKPTRAAVKAIRKAAGSSGKKALDTEADGHAEKGKDAKAAPLMAEHNRRDATTADGAHPPMQEGELPASAQEAFAKMREERSRELAERPARMEAGEAALKRLLPIAQRDTGQSQVIARFLLNLYNGNRFPFDNTDLRRLDHELVEDCVAVLRMDARPFQEVHRYFENGSKIWETLAKNWGFRDFYGEDSWRTTNAEV